MNSPVSSPELASTSQSLGAFIAELRQAQGLSYHDVSIRIKYSALQLEALEKEDWQALPNGMPLRWMVKSYARLLGADESLLLGMLEEQTGVTATHNIRQKKKQWDGADMSLYTEPTQRAWGWWLIIALLLLIALFYALDQGWIPENWLVFDWLKEFQS